MGNLLWRKSLVKNGNKIYLIESPYPISRSYHDCPKYSDTFIRGLVNEYLTLLPELFGGFLLFFSQCRPWSDTTFSGIWSGPALFTSSWPLWLSWMPVGLVISRLRVRPPLCWQHSYVEIDHEIFSTVKKGSCQFLGKEYAQYCLTT